MGAAAANNRRRVEQDSASLDYISGLPDEMLLIIISFLPSKSTFMTSFLSKRCRRLWCFVPLKLIVDEDLSGWESYRADAVSKILATQPGLAKLLSISFFTSQRRLGPKHSKWFRSSALDGLKDLTFQGGKPKPCTLPWSAFRFAPTLRLPRLSYCIITKFDAAPEHLFPQLKQLELKVVELSEVVIEALLAYCTVLEGLLLQKIHGFRSLHLVSPNLHELSVCGLCKNNFLRELQQLVIQDEPCLFKLVVFGPVARRSVRIAGGGAPKLKVLAYQPKNSFQIRVGAITNQSMVPLSSSLTMSMREMNARAVWLLDGRRDISYVARYLKWLQSNDKKFMESEIDNDTKRVLHYYALYPMDALINMTISTSSDEIYTARDCPLR